MNTPRKPRSVVIAFDDEDRSELFHVIKSRGESAFRRKLLSALRALDPELVDRIEKEDDR